MKWSRAHSPTLVSCLSPFVPQLLFPTLRYVVHCPLFLVLTVFIPDILANNHEPWIWMYRVCLWHATQP